MKSVAASLTRQEGLAARTLELLIYTANRRDLVERFGISKAQAALDFRLCLDLARDTPPSYDPVRKTYIAANQHKPLASFGLTDALDILITDSEDIDAATLPCPERQAERRTIVRLHQAIRSKSALCIRYTSMITGAQGDQWIAPTRFTPDGESVHLRAFSVKHEKYRHYLPIRIEPDSKFAERPLDR